MRVNISAIPWILVPLLILSVSACDLVSPDTVPEPGYVVESYQIAGQPLQPVFLSRTASLDGSYSFSELAVSDADVRVGRLTSAGDIEISYRYREQSAGVYVPEDPAVVEPLGRYRLIAEPPSADQSIRAETVVPDTFRVLAVTADTVVYQADRQLSVRVSRSQYPERDEVYLFTNEALNPRISRLTPFYADVADSDTADVIQEYRKNSSPLLNAANYGSESDPSLTMRLPWLMFAFYGSNEVTAQAVDDNLYDFLRSQAVQQGGPTTLGPGEIPSILEHVEGGTGVFGSYARASLKVYLSPSGL